MTKEEIVSLVIEQFQQDLADKDTASIHELLMFTPIPNLVAYLPETEEAIVVELSLMDYLVVNGFDFKQLNNGFHIVVIGKDFQTYDVYPTTEKWKSRAATEYRKDLKNFYRELEGK